jgi:nucleoside-triphosphatase THEP1
VINILTGPVQSGKTTSLKNTLPILKEKNFVIDGYLSKAVWINREFIGYDLVDLKDLRHRPFIRKQGHEDWEKIGAFFFLPETLDIAKKIIRLGGKKDLLVVDEVGPLELKGKGVWSALEEILMIPERNILLVVRKSIMKDFLEKIQKDDLVVYDIEQTKKPLRVLEPLVENLERGREPENR